MRSQIENVLAVHAILSEVYGKSPWSLKQIAADMAQDNVDYFFVENEEKAVVGFLSVQQLVGELEITNIAVAKSHQGQGLGAQLMAFLDKVDFPICLEVRESNKPAQALYQRKGFKAVGQRKNYYHEPVEDAVVMKREGMDER